MTLRFLLPDFFAVLVDDGDLCVCRLSGDGPSAGGLGSGLRIQLQDPSYEALSFRRCEYDFSHEEETTREEKPDELFPSEERRVRDFDLSLELIGESGISTVEHCRE